MKLGTSLKFYFLCVGDSEKFCYKNSNYERNEAEVIIVRYENDTASWD